MNAILAIIVQISLKNSGLQQGLNLWPCDDSATLSYEAMTKSWSYDQAMRLWLSYEATDGHLWVLLYANA